MPFEKSIGEMFEIGKPIFESLFNLNDNDLKEKIKDICKDHEDVLNILNNKNCKCVRTIINEKPNKIEFYFYDTIEIIYLGIYYKSEYGENISIRRFDEYFKL